MLIILSLLLALSGCERSDDTLKEREQLIEALYGSVELEGSNDGNIGDATTSNFVLPYTRSDTLNPYMCESTLNAAITDLIYDQLIAVNSEFEAELELAIQIEQTSDRLITVILRDGIVFSDGSELSGRDIKYSFSCAKADGSRYQKQLRNFAGCMTQDNIVYFRLEDPDPRAYLLLDFPIVKFNTGGTTAVPIGSGRYTYISDVEKGTYLMRNPLWYSTDPSEVKRISLVSMPTIESIVHSIEIGTVSYYFTDLRDGYPSRINANYATVDLNNLIFIGMNTSEPGLAKFGVRHAISLALDREDIVTTAYAGRAYAATGPFTTSWPTAAAAQTGSTLSDSSAAETALHDSGFLSVDTHYVRTDTSGNRLAFTLLVNSENRQHVAAAERVVDQLSPLGISVTIDSRSYEDYRAAIAAGQYTLYLGEYSLFNNMDLSDLYTPNRGMYYGPTPQTTIDAYSAFRHGTFSVGDFIDAFDSELPFIPVCYRLGMVCYSRSLSANMDVTESDFFLHMNLWDVALAASVNDKPAEEDGTAQTEGN